jgi:hypothetical protein
VTNVFQPLDAAAPRRGEGVGINYRRNLAQRAAFVPMPSNPFVLASQNELGAMKASAHRAREKVLASRQFVFC